MTSPVEQLAFVDLGSLGAGSSAPDVSRGSYFRITCTATTRTIANPINGIKDTPTGQVNVALDPGDIGRKLYIEIKATGGALTVTWGALFKGAPTAIASANRRVLEFIFDGVNWVTVNTGADVPN
jgi:hypothetical protein